MSSVRSYVTSGENQIDQQRKDSVDKMIPCDILMLVAGSFSSFNFDATFFSLKIEKRFIILR